MKQQKARSKLLTKRYILSPTIVVDAPYSHRVQVTNASINLSLNSENQAAQHTTSLGGTFPDVLRAAVVKSETECMVGFDYLAVWVQQGS